jgi:cellulose biosynthesis protein BcsQ
VIIPVHPSPFDIWGARELCEIIQSRRNASAGLPGLPPKGVPHAYFIFSQAIKHTRLLREMIEPIEQTGLGLLNNMTTYFECYKRCVMEGESVFSFNENTQEAREQIELITNEILGVINENA